LWCGLLRSRPLQNLTFTHAHLDHFGLASYFVKEMKCAVRLPLAEWLNAWKMWHEREAGPDEHFAAFMKRNGASDDDAAQIMGAQRRSTYPGLRPFGRTRAVLLRKRQDPDRGRSGAVAHDAIGDHAAGAAGGQPDEGISG